MKFAPNHIFKDQAFCDNVLQTDESKCNVFEVYRRKKVWRYSKEVLKPQNLKSTIKHGGGSIIVWGCIVSNGVEKWNLLRELWIKT